MTRHPLPTRAPAPQSAACRQPTRPAPLPLSLAQHLSPMALAVALAWPAGVAAQALARPPATALPVRPAAPAGKPDPWLTGGAATYTTGGTAAAPLGTVNQTSNRAIYQWDSFNIGAAAKLRFELPGAASSALNRIGGTAPSQIFGQLSSNGLVYLINPNGIVFGSGARVDVGGLVASTLGITDAEFNSGLTNSIISATSPAFRYDGTPEGWIDSRQFVRVEQGASIVTASGGRVWLFAKKVDNAGSIHTPDGQAVLGAGAEVFLNSPTVDEARQLYASETNPDTPATRGLLVEMGSGSAASTGVTAATAATAAANSMAASNAATGEITAPRGNVTLVGLAVNQLGRVSATTSVSSNGSIFLLARGAARAADAGTFKTAHSTGLLTLGAGSQTGIQPDGAAPGVVNAAAEATADAASSFTASRLELNGRSIVLAPGAQINAPGAVANLRAEVLPTVDGADDTKLNQLRPSVADSRILLGEGAVINLAGTTSTVVSAARNFVTTDLLGSNDLKDAPLQKAGPLLRNTVTLDIRSASPILGSLQSYRDSVQQTAAEKLASGGSLTLIAGGGVLVADTARLDVSGGSVRYTSALVSPSLLVAADGSRYSLNAAPADLAYSRVEGAGTRQAVQKDRWGTVPGFGGSQQQLEAAYDAGQSAGLLRVLAPVVRLGASVAGYLNGSTLVGERQRLGLDARAATGRLQVGLPADGSSDATTLQRADLWLQRQPDALDAAYWPGTANGAAAAINLPLPQRSQLSTVALGAAGFGQISLATDGSLYLASALALADGASLRLAALGAAGVQVDGSITAHGGSVLLSTARKLGQPGTVRLGAGQTIDVSGSFINRLQDGGSSSFASAGGSVQLLGAGGVDVAAGSVIDVSGGALLAGSGSLVGASAGSITLRAGVDTSDGLHSVALPFTLAGSLRAQSLVGGGALTLRAASLRIGTATAADAAAQLTLDAGFFSQGGFTRFDLDGQQWLDLAAGTQAVAQASTWLASPQRLRHAASGSLFGSSLGAVLGSSTMPEGQRQASRISLSSSGSGGQFTDGRLTLGAGALLQTDAGGRLALSAATTLDLAGTLQARGGSVALTLTRSDAADLPGVYATPRTLWLGAGSVIDVSGQMLPAWSTDGLRRGQVLDGGTVTLDASKGPPSSLVLASGSRLDLRGAQGTLDVTVAGTSGSQVQATRITSNGGSLVVAANQRLLLEGDVLAAAGGVAGGAVSGAVGGVTGGAADGAAGQGAVAGSLSINLASVFDGANRVGEAARPAERALRLQQAATQRSLGQTVASQVPAQPGETSLSTTWVQAAGFASLALQAADRIDLQGTLQLALAGRLVLDAGAIRSTALDANPAQASLSAATLNLGNSGAQEAGRAVRPALDLSTPLPAVLRSASSGSGSLLLQAGLIDLQGALVTQGLGQLTLASRGDLRLLSNGTSSRLDTRADVQLSAAQVAPATDVNFTLEAPGRLVRLDSAPGTAAASTTAPLSAAGQLTVQAASIVQAGVLRAPAGRISLEASQSITLAQGSLTSVSSNGLVLPWGSTVSGTAWRDSLGNAVAAPLEKTVNLSAPAGRVDLQAGARVDLAGGGALQAFEFIPGPGGAVDVFAGAGISTASPAGAFAIVPGVQGFAPVDRLLAGLTSTQAGTVGLAVGRQITVGAVAGLPAGSYTLLPARYALLPGAFLVSPVVTSAATPVATSVATAARQIGASVAQPNGSWLTGARLSTLGTGAVDALPGTWRLTPGTVARQSSEIRISSADTFFTAAALAADSAVPRRPIDAGSLNLAAAATTLNATLGFGMHWHWHWHRAGRQRRCGHAGGAGRRDQHQRAAHPRQQ